MTHKFDLTELPPPQLPIPRCSDPDGIGLVRVHRILHARVDVVPDPPRDPRRSATDDTFRLRVVL